MPDLLICWDTNVWSAFLKNEEDKDLASIEAFLKDVRGGRLRILVPTVVTAELYAMADENLPQVEAAFLGSYFEHADLTPTVARDAGRLRRRIIEARSAKKLSLKRPPRIADCLVLATAELYRASALHSYDPDLLGLNGELGIQTPISQPSYDEGHDLFRAMLGD